MTLTLKPLSAAARETILFFVAVGLLVSEIMFMGARPSVLTVLTGLIFAPIGMRIERISRENGNGKVNKS